MTASPSPHFILTFRMLCRCTLTHISRKKQNSDIICRLFACGICDQVQLRITAALSPCPRYLAS